MRKRKLVILALTVALGGAAVGWVFFGDAIRGRLGLQRFDPVAWQDRKGLASYVRSRMVNDLLRRHDFRGMTREQVTAIIGEPDKTDYFKEWDMVYWLGPERGWMPIDSEWLVFRLDSQKKVAQYEIVTD